MDKAALLTEFKSLIDYVPDFSTFTPTSCQHQTWLAKVKYLFDNAERYQSTAIHMSISSMSLPIMRDSNLHTIMQALYSQVEKLERELGSSTSSAKVFGPGAVYDFSKAIRDLLLSANQRVLIVDPYLDEEIFDYYLNQISKSVRTDLLTRKHSPTLALSAGKFRTQFGPTFNLRISTSLHDRVIFIDDRTCYVMGQSIKDAAKQKITYLAPLPNDAATIKLEFYNELWDNSVEL